MNGRALLFAGGAILFVGCGLEAPKAPRFETDLYLPLGTQSATGRDMVHGSDYLTADSSAAGPLHLRFDGEVSPFTVGELLDIRIGAATWRGGLESLHLDAPADTNLGFPLRALAGVDLPDDGSAVLVPSFDFHNIASSLPRSSSFTWARLGGGTVSVELDNQTPVPLGGAAHPLTVRVRNQVHGTTAFEAQWPSELRPGESLERAILLQGVELDAELAVEVSGGSAGSVGPVVPRSTDALAVRVRFDSLEPDSLIAKISAEELSLSGTVSLSSDGGIRLSGGTLRDGALGLALSNRIPLDWSGQLRFPDLERDGAVLAASVSVHAGTPEQPALTDRLLDLSHATLLMAGPSSTLHWELDLHTPGSGARTVSVGLRDQIEVATRSSTLAFQELHGLMRERRVSIPSATTTIDPPEGLDRLRFEQATLAMTVENGLALPAHAALTIEGLNPQAGPPITLILAADVAAGELDGPRTSRIDWSSQTTPLLDLIHSRPRQLRLSGELSVGTGTEEVTVRRSDQVSARYIVDTPLRASIGRVSYRSEPFRFTISPDVHDAIRDDLVSASADGVILNHFPAGLSAELAFASSADSLGVSTVRIDPIRCLAGNTDSSGRVAATRENPFSIEIDPDDLRFFARDAAWGQVRLVAEGDSSRSVLVTEADFVEVKALLRFRIRVAP
ncbi:MAG: hypothetical protein U0527_09210 [Candidatus Eisenbacteria bacterium]